jgi:pimeloyl-ACP methyl ester carboxylesterase
VGRSARAAWRTGGVASADGTAVSFLTVGHGPGLVVIPGNNRRAYHYAVLTDELSATFTIHVIDRRGRGLSGQQGPAYSLESEVDDALAVMQHTGAERIFGHSCGGLVGLHVALRRDVAALVVYEPGVSIHGSFDGSWLPEFAQLLRSGRHNAAVATFLN